MKSKKIKFAVIGCVLLAGIGLGVRWYMATRFMESTDDAYLRGDISAISSRVGGEIVAVRASANRPVNQGDLLIELDTRDYQARLANASAQVAQAEAALEANQRQQELGTGDKRMLDAERNGLHAKVNSAVALAHLAQLDLDATKVYAPVSGIVGNLVAQVGERIPAGARLLSIVPSRDFWVEANFKETQLQHISAGQEAKVSLDALPGQVFTGRVDSLAPASGSEFALLPAENATGNFNKIVQRVAVRISLPDDETARGWLRPGLSARVSVNTQFSGATIVGSAQ